MAPSDELEALAKRHGALSYRNRADTQNPAFGFSEDGLNGLIDEVLAKWGSPQPVVREPLSDAQIAEMMRDTWGCASIAPRHALEFARAVERAHGIPQKGGSEGWKSAPLLSLLASARARLEAKK